MATSSATGSLDAYLDRVLAPDDRVLFEEAARAAAVGARRAAYIMVWLSCAESLKRKFRELASRDNKAQKVIGEVTHKESLHHSIDKFILDEAKRYGFLTDSEHHRLEYVYEMRCIFGHPYEQQPSQEELISAAATVVDVVLGRPTKLREGYLSEQVRLISEDPTFLDDVQEAAECYASEVCTRADERLHLWFLTKLWAKLTTFAADPASAIFVRRGIWFSREFLRLANCIGSAEWNAVSYLTRFPAIFSSTLATPDLFLLIDAHAQDIVIGNLLNTGASEGAHLRLLEALHDAGVLNDRQESRIIDELGKMQLDHLAASGISVVYYADLIVERLRVHNWYTQNPAVGILENAGPLAIARIPPTTQYLLGENVLQAADGESTAAIGFLEELVRTNEAWPKSFIEGLVSECFVNGDGEVRFKTKRAREALTALRVVSEASRTAVIDRLVGRIIKGKLQPRWDVAEKRAKMLDIIHGVIQVEGSPLNDLHRLAETLAALEVPPDDE